jgi:hypothetical protein
MPSPIFTINGSDIATSTAVAEGGAVVCTLVDITGVAPVTWSVGTTDETTQASDYSFVQSGSVGQTFTGTGLGPGTAANIVCTVAGGLERGELTTALTKRGKFFVPTVEGFEVLTADEQNNDNRVSSITHGMIKPTNEAIRQLSNLDGEDTCSAGATDDVWTRVMPENSVLGAKLRLAAWDTVTFDAAYYEIYAAWKRVGAAAPVTVAPGRIDEVVFEDGGAAAWTFFANVTGNSARFQFVGDATNDTAYKFSVEILPFTV